FWKTSSLFPGQPGGDGHRLPFVNEGALGLSAATDDCHYSVPDPEARRAWTGGLHFARQLEAGDVRGHTRWCRVTAPHPHEIGRVDTGGADGDQELAQAGSGIGMLAELEGAVDDGAGAHGLSRRWRDRTEAPVSGGGRRASRTWRPPAPSRRRPSRRP